MVQAMMAIVHPQFNYFLFKEGRLAKIEKVWISPTTRADCIPQDVAGLRLWMSVSSY